MDPFIESIANDVKTVRKRLSRLLADPDVDWSAEGANLADLMLDLAYITERLLQVQIALHALLKKRDG